MNQFQTKIALLKETRAQLISIIESLNKETQINSEWYLRKFLAHLAGWDQEGVDSMQFILKGRKPASFRKTINGFNKSSIRLRRKLTDQQILKQMKSLHREFIKRLKSLDDNQFVGFFGTTLHKQPINILWLIQEAINHDQLHLRELKKLQKRAEDNLYDRQNLKVR